ncbi:hypothetical protein VM98_28550 [Streptomyces rubellomurinus subsp. indigoferus]|nr:hypothetical protein VM98_28550 [Streptomyces rubellomurinus subsp. indigoferus]
MGFDFPFGSQVVELAFQQVSDEFPFSDLVPIEIGETYLRVIALWRDNQALGGKAPTVEVRSGQGGLTPLTVTPLGEGTTAVPVIGTDGVVAAQGTCVRGNDDVYLVHLFAIAETNGPWQLRLTNNDPQTLHFVAISSTDPDQTLQPWMVWGATPGNFTAAGDPNELHVFLPGLFTTHAVTVRNLGTAPLVFDEKAGESIGGPDSPAVMAALPARTDPDHHPLIAPHGVDQIVFGVHHNGADADTTVTHTVQANDERHQAQLTILVKRTNYPPPSPGAPCNIDHCPGYVPPPPYEPALGAPTTGPCGQTGCGHGEGFHGLGPACRLDDGCPGYRSANGGTSGAEDDVCVQPGCGHTWGESHKIHHQPPPDTHCRRDDGCRAFLGGPGLHAICRRDICGHPFTDHTELPT